MVDLEVLAPSMADDDMFRRSFAMFLRRSASPSAAQDLARMNTQIDVRPVLRTIRVPTLVLQRIGDRDVHIDEGKYIAAQILNSKFAALPWNDHLWWVGDCERVLNEVEQFLVAQRHITEPDRLLVTIDAIKLLNGHDWPAQHALLDQTLVRFHGRIINLEPTVVVAAF